MESAVSRRQARRQAVILLYQQDVTGLPVPELVENALRAGEHADDPFTREVVDGVEGDRADLDARITAAATGWSADRIAPLERNILRVGAWEIAHDHVPVPVAIDEAVEMAKKWCGSDAPGFVNGVLGRLAREASGEAA